MVDSLVHGGARSTSGHYSLVIVAFVLFHRALPRQQTTLRVQDEQHQSHAVSDTISYYDLTLMMP